MTFRINPAYCDISDYEKVVFSLDGSSFSSSAIKIKLSTNFVTKI